MAHCWRSSKLSPMWRSDTNVASEPPSPRQRAEPLPPARGSAAQARQPDPEWLDELPPDDARAVASRSDLRRINRLMGHVPLLVDAWRQNEPDRWIQTVVELGAGDGTFLLNCARSLSAKSGPFKVVLVDRVKLVTAQTLDGFRELGWIPEVVTADVFDWVTNAQVLDSAFIANLFLHHFDHDRLGVLFEQISRQANFFVAVEPRRALAPLFCSKLLGLLGCNDVTR